MKSYNSTDHAKEFLARAIEEGKKGIVALAASRFGVSRQTVHKYLSDMLSQGILEAAGRTKARVYKLRTLSSQEVRLAIRNDLQEDVVWRQHFAKLLSGLAENVRSICNYGLTEILNNAIDHSSGSYVTARLGLTYASVYLDVEDDGMGIFKKIKDGLGLADEREAILELSKGKVTTNPQRHSGEGIFFTSRMFDMFLIAANRLNFVHHGAADDWLIEDDLSERPNQGTWVRMELSTWTDRTTQEVFDKYTSGKDYPGFDKTRVPVNLLLVGEENLVSRSQAKRLLARFSRFKEVILDFKGVKQIGQAFADEIFRVFAGQHPGIKIIPLGMNDQVSNMVKRVRHP